MSARALEFVETWVSEKIEATAMSAATTGAALGAQAAALAQQCVKDAQADGIPKSEIDQAFDDLAAFIAGQIDEARDRGTDRSGEDHPGSLIDTDDTRVVDEEADEEDAKGA